MRSEEKECVRLVERRRQNIIKFKHSGTFKNSDTLFKKVKQRSYIDALEKYGQAGVDALSAATPNNTGTTAASWNYEIVENRRGYSIYWTNSHENRGVNIALILQYGHGTGTGGYVKGIDYINPAIRPIFEKLANAAWKEVTVQ